MANGAGWRAIVLGSSTRSEKLKVSLMLAYAFGWLFVPAVVSLKFQFVFPGLCAATIMVPLFLWLPSKVVKLPQPNSKKIPEELVAKFDQLRQKLGFPRLVLQSMMTAKHPQAAVTNEYVNLSEHVLQNWPSEAILWQSEVELRAKRKVIPITVGYALIVFPLCELIPVFQSYPIFPVVIAFLLGSFVAFILVLYRSETHALLVIDKDVTKTDADRAAAKIALSDPYFYVENMKWHERPLSISPKWLKRRAENLGITLERISEKAS
ncbi:MAG TPA: hypothetical protein VK171_08560 [Fimbriimonas sp.]|nr:hypothetical protein [Fimbriimonas sp.]